MYLVPGTLFSFVHAWLVLFKPGEAPFAFLHTIVLLLLTGCNFSPNRVWRFSGGLVFGFYTRRQENQHPSHTQQSRSSQRGH